MESLGVSLGCFGFSDDAHSVAPFVSGKRNRSI